MTTAELAAFLGRVGEVRERGVKVCTGPSEYLDAECLELLVATARTDLPAALDAVEALVELLRQAPDAINAAYNRGLIESPDQYFDKSGVTAKRYAKIEDDFRARISQAIGL